MQEKKPWEIRVGMLISYDAELAFTSLPLVYRGATKIVLALDQDRLTWNGERFHLPENFHERIRELDVDHKIEIYEDHFYSLDRTVIENDTHERQLLAARMGVGGWHLQVDADEYFVDFDRFVSALRQIETDAKGPIKVSADWVTLFQRNPSGVFFVTGGDEPVPVATNAPRYEKARNIFDPEYLSVRVRTPVVHESWARSPGEIRQKLTNWGHKADFETESYFQFWASIDTHNYKYIRDFHPMMPGTWPRLEFAPGGVSDLISKLQKEVSGRPLELQRQKPAQRSNFLLALRRIGGLLLPPVFPLLVNKLGFNAPKK